MTGVKSTSMETSTPTDEELSKEKDAVKKNGWRYFDIRMDVFTLYGGFLEVEGAGPEDAAFLSSLWRWHTRANGENGPPKPFHVAQKYLARETMLSAYMQKKARQFWSRRGFLDEDSSQTCGRIFYRIRPKRVLRVLGSEEMTLYSDLRAVRGATFKKVYYLSYLIGECAASRNNFYTASASEIAEEIHLSSGQQRRIRRFWRHDVHALREERSGLRGALSFSIIPFGIRIRTGDAGIGKALSGALAKCGSDP